MPTPFEELLAGNARGASKPGAHALTEEERQAREEQRKRDNRRRMEARRRTTVVMEYEFPDRFKEVFEAEYAGLAEDPRYAPKES